MNKKTLDKLIDVIALCIVHHKKVIEHNPTITDLLEIGSLTPEQNEIDFVMENDEVSRAFLTATIACIARALNEDYVRLNPDSVFNSN